MYRYFSPANFLLTFDLLYLPQTITFIIRQNPHRHFIVNITRTITSSGRTVLAVPLLILLYVQTWRLFHILQCLLQVIHLHRIRQNHFLLTTRLKFTGLRLSFIHFDTL